MYRFLRLVTFGLYFLAGASLRVFRPSFLGMMPHKSQLKADLFSRNSVVMMAASGGGARGGGGGSTKIDNRTKQDIKTRESLKDEIEKDWRLIVHDDNIHTIQQVCEIISRCCPLCSGARAYEVTLETHMTGAGTVAVANKKIIGEYCKSLQVAGLSVSMAPDDEFEGEEGDEGGE